MKLTEAYAKRIKLAESIYSRANEGAKMDNNRKMVLAQCLKNVESFLNESFTSAVGTQRADMGAYKKFCVNLTNIAVPQLIAPDLVITKPMSSLSGYITYIQYSAATNKGATEAGSVFNDPFALQNMDETYTSSKVVESFESAPSKVAWTPCVEGAVKAYTADGTPVEGITVAKDGTLSGSSLSTVRKVAYAYDNEVVPQNDLPRLKAEMKNIPLTAKARRIAVYYSQLAAFQAKTDYGFDLGDQLAEQAVGRLAYEIDTEVVKLLADTAEANTSVEDKAELTWSKTLPVGVSKRDHYAGFAEVIEIANAKIYKATQRFAATYMIIDSAIKPVLAMMDNFKAASTSNVNGPYMAGTLNGIKVYVSPALSNGEYYIGVNGNDYMSSVACYAPYMPIVPTQLLQYADGGTSQGFSTMYDLVVLNDKLIVAGKVTA